VLSFPIYDNGEFDATECASGAMLGDIVISIERAKEQAAEIGNSFLYEVAFLTVHSTLHLLGYDHERSAEDDELQCRIQKEIISSVEI
jgi:probable rRNA maturation factor